jgi:hypothetical protein
MQKDLATMPDTHKSHRRVARLRCRLSIAERVLAEYAWRETHLQDDNLDPLPVLALLYAVAGECRSKVNESVESELSLQPPEVLHCIYSLLLQIVENVPARLPRLHTFDAPQRGTQPDAWLTWVADQHR